MTNLPFKYVFYVGGALLVLAAMTALYASGRNDGIASMRPKLEAAQEAQAASALEATGAQETTVRTETTLRREAIVQARTTDVITAARRAPAAPLALDSAARLRGHDQFLCDESPALCGAAPGADAGDGG